ncbi:uncharacterized protein LOC119437291 [Dermacentor silvarum]|uniref:uncharacterized protein LOC119437291 n=1 Tax=Dermacentor silvarum TaxID=543639 RepID=UPI002100FF42|nr:uncharacterized protein LOC119437291 [Dermacentor silvarum]
MHVIFTAFLFVSLAGSALAGPLDLCDHVESHREKIMELFKCILSSATPELEVQLKQLKPKLYCSNYYIVVKKVCHKKPFAVFMREYLSTPELYGELEKLAQGCQKTDATARVQPEQTEPTPGLRKRIVDYMMWLADKASAIKDAIIRRVTFNKASSA